MVVHHYAWQIEDTRRTTECITMWPAYHDSQGYRLDSGFSGRVLYDWEGETYAGSIISLGKRPIRRNLSTA